MKRKIVLARGDASEIAKKFNCTREMVSKALNYKKDTMLARNILHVAMRQYDGVEVKFD